MISLFKKTVLCKSLFLRPSFTFSLSKEGVNQKLKAFHKAVMSSQIIQKIKESPLNYYQSIEPYDSLRQSVLDHIDKYQTNQSGVQYEAESIKAAKNEMRKCFDEGIWLPDDMCGQKRFNKFAGPPIRYPALKKMNEKVEVNVEEMDEDDLKKLSFRKIKFCPTYVITGQIFRKIMKVAGENLLKGQFGVGKTYSFLLYNILSENVFRYKHKHLNGVEQEDLPSEIDFTIPKSIYWNVNLSLSEISPNKFLNKLIKRQCYELKNELKDKDIFDLDENLTRLYYGQGMDLILFHDQINEMIAAQRAWISAYADYMKFINSYTSKASKTSDGQKTGTQNKVELDENEYNQKYRQLQKKLASTKKKRQDSELYSQIIRKLIPQGHFQRIIYLSSVDIEKKFLKKFELTGPSNHTPLPQISRLSYPIAVTGNIVIADTCEFIVFLMKSVWSSKIQTDDKISQSQFKQTLKKIKLELYNILSGEKKFGILLPLTLNQKIKDLKFEDFSKLTSEELKTKLRKFLIGTQDHTLGQIKQKVDSFINKTSGDPNIDSMKPILMLNLWLQSRRIVQQLEQTPKIIQKFDIQKQKQINDLPYQQINLKNIQIKQQWESALTAHLFGFQNSDLVSYVNPFILRRILNKQKRNIYQFLVHTYQPILKHIRPGNQGHLVESVFIDMFMPEHKGETTFAFLKPNKIEQLNLKNTIFWMNQINRQASGFMPIPKATEKEHKDYNFHKSFIQHIKIKLENNRDVENKWFLMLPLLKPQEKNFKQIVLEGRQLNQAKMWNSKSKLIDLAFFCYGSNQFSSGPILNIYAFDITTGEDEHFTKLEEFLQQFMNFQDKEQKFVEIQGQKVKVTLNYYVITTLDFNDDYQKHFKTRITSLKKKKKSGKLQQNKKKLLEALESFNFKDEDSICILSKINKRGLKKESILKSIGILPMFDPKLIVKNPNKSNINLHWQLLKKLRKQVLMK